MIYLIGCSIILLAYVARLVWLGYKQYLKEQAKDDLRLCYRQYLKEQAKDEQRKVSEAQPQVIEMPPLVMDGTAVNRNGGNGHHGEFIMRRE